MYKTGDLCRRWEDGTIEYQGRLDDQVKVRGYRIELGEIESELRKCDGVRDAAVVAREERGDKELVAYVIGDADAKTLKELKRELAQRLPSHMVPTSWVSMKEFPLTPSGKLDRRALPAPERGSADEYVPPRTDAERRMAAIFAEVLGLERVGVDDDFFLIGGHSLRAMQLASRIGKELSCALPLRAVFESRTVEALARVVAESVLRARKLQRSSGRWLRVARCPSRRSVSGSSSVSKLPASLTTCRWLST